MSNQDYCVYARSILGRLDRISNPTTQFTADIVHQSRESVSQSNDINMGLVFMGGMIILFLIMSFLKKRQQQPLSKLQ